MPDLVNDILWFDNDNYGALDLRRGSLGGPIGPGVPDASHWKATLAGGMLINFAGGVGHIKCIGLTDSGYYRTSETATYGVTVPGNATANPRLDQIVLRVYDQSIDPGAGARKGTIELIQGDTSVPGATLDNRANAKDLTTLTPAGTLSVMPLLDVLTPAGGPTSIPSGNIRDRRPFMPGSTPAIGDAAPMVYFRPAAGVQTAASINGSDNGAGKRAAALMVLDRAIKGATHIRFRLQHDSPVVAATRNIQVAICDSSGTLIRKTGSTAIFNTSSAFNQMSFKIPYDVGGAYDWYPGSYWVWCGMSSNFSGSGEVLHGYFAGAYLSATPAGANLFRFDDSAAGVSFPAAGNILGMTDVTGAGGTANDHMKVPVPGLSVG